MVKTKSTLGVGVLVGSGVAVGGRGVAVKVGGNGVDVLVGSGVWVGVCVGAGVAVGGTSVGVAVGGNGVGVAVSMGVAVLDGRGTRVTVGVGVGVAVAPQPTSARPDKTMPTAKSMGRNIARAGRWDLKTDNNVARITFPLRTI